VQHSCFEEALPRGPKALSGEPVGELIGWQILPALSANSRTDEPAQSNPGGEAACQDGFVAVDAAGRHAQPTARVESADPGSDP
jgi:hypothetical protein